MRSGNGNKNSPPKISWSHKQKNNFARAAHPFCTFLCRCFALLQRETSRNILVSPFFEQMLYVFLLTFVFNATYFHFFGR